MDTAYDIAREIVKALEADEESCLEVVWGPGNDGVSKIQMTDEAIRVIERVLKERLK